MRNLILTPTTFMTVQLVIDLRQSYIGLFSSVHLPQFFDLLVQINSTIENFFSQANVSEEDLRLRVEVALRRAEMAE